MKIIKNRVFACIIMIITILLCIGFNSYLSLSKMYNNINNSFYSNSSDAIQVHLNTKITTANNMSSIAKKYFQASSDIISSVTNDVASLSNSEGISEKYKKSQSLSSSVDNLYYEMNNTSGISQSDLTELSNLYKSFNSVNDALTKSTYNQTVDEYNNALSKFPANIVKAITNLKSADAFK